MFCKNCGANIADGEVFCPECGTKQDVAAQDSFAADTAPAADGTAAVAKKSVDKKKIGIIAGVVAAVVLIIILICSLGGGKGKELDFALYRKDGNLYINYFSDGTTKKLSSDGGDMPIYCEANGYLYFIDDYDEGSYTLRYTDTTIKKAEKRTVEKLVSGVGKVFTVSADGKIVYYETDEGVLYAHNYEEKTKIGKDITACIYDDNGYLSAYIEREEDDDEIAYNLFSINKKYEKTEVLKDIEEYEYIYDDNYEFSRVLVYANDTISVYKDGKLETVKSSFSIDEDEDFDLVYIDDKNNFYYTLGEAGEGVDLDTIITDSLKESDESITKPDDDDTKYWVDPSVNYSWQTELNDQYLKDLKAYREKELRDEIRELIEEGVDVDGIATAKLFYFDGKTDTAVVENVVDAENLDNGIIYYEKADMAENATVDIKDLAAKMVKEQDADREFNEYSSYYASLWTLGGDISSLLATGATKGVLVDNTPCAVKSIVNEDADEDEKNNFDSLYVRIDEEASAIYFRADYDEETNAATLYKMKIKSKALGEAEKVYEDVRSYWFDAENNLFTGRDPQIDKDTTAVTVTVYMNDNKIADDVAMDNDRNLDSGEYIYVTDYSQKHGTYKLNMYNGKKSEAIAEDVHDYYAMSAEKILFIDDYDDGEGTLRIWTGAKDGPAEIDDDVSAIIVAGVIEKK